jgi:hypothetical protein
MRRRREIALLLSPFLASALICVSNEAKRQSNADAESQLIAEARCPS